MSADNPTALEIIEAEAKGLRRDVQDIAHDDTIGVLLTLLYKLDGKSIYVCDVQDHTFFDQGSKDGGSDDLGIPYVKTAAETSIRKGRETPNKQSMAITALSLSRRGARATFSAPSLGTVETTLGLLPQFQAFVAGQMEMIDRAGLVLPFEIGGHPGFLEDVFDSIRSRAVITPKFGEKVSGDPIRADRIPCGDATSGLRAAGSPETFNRLKLPLGYIWRPDNSSADSQFGMEIKIPKAFLYAVNTPAFGFNVSGTPAYASPTKVMIDFTLRVHGRAISPTSGNAG